MAWLTYHFGTTYYHPDLDTTYQTLNTPISILLFLVLAVAPLKWPQFVIFPVFAMAVHAHNLMMGVWWQDYWAQRPKLETLDFASVYDAATYYLLLPINTATPVMIWTGWLCVRQVAKWACLYFAPSPIPPVPPPRE